MVTFNELRTLLERILSRKLRNSIIGPGFSTRKEQNLVAAHRVVSDQGCIIAHSDASFYDNKMAVGGVIKQDNTYLCSFHQCLGSQYCGSSTSQNTDLAETYGVVTSAIVLYQVRECFRCSCLGIKIRIDCEKIVEFLAKNPSLNSSSIQDKNLKACLPLLRTYKICRDRLVLLGFQPQLERTPSVYNNVAHLMAQHGAEFGRSTKDKSPTIVWDYPQLAGFDEAWEHDFPSSPVILGDNDINLWEANYIHVLGQTAKVINLAEDEARRLGHNFVASEQILLGLIGERTGIAANVLKKMGITLEDARAEVLEIIGRTQDHVPEEIPFTPRAKCVVDFALEEANKQGKNYIGTEHLLLGLLEESGGVPARVLENLGADPSNIRTHVMKMLGESSNKDFLGDYTIDLTKLEEGKLHLFVGSDVLAEKKVIKLLHQGRHICLIGDDKERNKATLEAVSRRLASSRMKVISLDTDLIASARRHRGDHEEIMKNGIEDIKKLGKVVLHVEELLTKSGVKGPVIAVNSLIKAIDDKEVQLITSATQFDYNNTFQHKDNLRDILPVQVRVPTTKEIVDILKVVRKQYEVHYKVIYTDVALTLAAHLSTGDFRLAVDMIDEAGYLAQFNYAKSKHTEAKELMEELEKMRTDKKKAEKKTDFEEAAKLRDWASDLSLQIAAIMKIGKEMSKPEIEGKDLTVREANVASAFEILGNRYPVKK